MKTPLLYTSFLAAALSLSVPAAHAAGVDAGMPVQSASAAGSTTNIENKAVLSADLSAEAEAAAAVAPAAGTEAAPPIMAPPNMAPPNFVPEPAVDSAIDAETTADTNADSAAGTTATDAVNDSPVTTEDSGDETAAETNAITEGAGVAAPDTMEMQADTATGAAEDAATEETLTEDAAGQDAGEFPLPADDPTVSGDAGYDGFGEPGDVTAAETVDPVTALAEADYAASHTVGDVANMDVIGANGKNLGHVDQIVTGDDEQAYAVVKTKGFMGLGRKEVLVPVDVMTLDTDEKKILLSGTSTLNGYEKFRNGDYTAISESDPLDTLDLQLRIDTGDQTRVR